MNSSIIISNMDNIVIKSLPASEWRTYKKIRLEALKISPEAFSSRYEEAVKISDEEWQKQMQQSEKNAGMLLLFAFDGDEVIGMNGYYWSDKPVMQHIANVFGVYVNPSYRGKGIGRKLMEGILDEIKKNMKFYKMKIGVNAENIPALSLYQSCGLQIVGRFKNELRYGEKFCDEILLEMMIQ